MNVPELFQIFNWERLIVALGANNKQVVQVGTVIKKFGTLLAVYKNESGEDLADLIVTDGIRTDLMVGIDATKLLKVVGHIHGDNLHLDAINPTLDLRYEGGQTNMDGWHLDFNPTYIMYRLIELHGSEIPSVYIDWDKFNAWHEKHDNTAGFVQKTASNFHITTLFDEPPNIESLPELKMSIPEQPYNFELLSTMLKAMQQNYLLTVLLTRMDEDNASITE